MQSRIFFCGDLSYKDIILKLLKSDTHWVEVDTLEKADLVYCVYGKGPKFNFKTFGFWLGNRQKYILHWIGTDVLSHVNKIKRNSNIQSLLYHRLWNYVLKRKTRKGSMINLCCAPWLCDELKQTGINANYLPLTTLDEQKFSFVESDRNIDFLSYLPQNRQDLYNAGEVFRLAERFKAYNFLIIVPDAETAEEIRYQKTLPNVTFVSKMTHEETVQLYRRSKIFLRFTEHDGLSLSVIESLASRIHVFWTYPFTHANHCQMPVAETTFSEIEKVIRNWQPNEKGQDYVLSELNSEVTKIKFDNLLKSFL